MKTISDLSDREILELLLASQAQMHLDILSLMKRIEPVNMEALMGQGNIAQEYVNMSSYLKKLKESTIEG